MRRKHGFDSATVPRRDQDITLGFAGLAGQWLLLICNQYTQLHVCSCVQGLELPVDAGAISQARSLPRQLPPAPTPLPRQVILANVPWERMALLS